MSEYCFPGTVFPPNQSEGLLELNYLQSLCGIAAEPRDGESFERRHLADILLNANTKQNSVISQGLES
jgi:hypothetical protein